MTQELPVLADHLAAQARSHGLWLTLRHIQCGQSRGFVFDIGQAVSSTVAGHSQPIDRKLLYLEPLGTGSNPRYQNGANWTLREARLHLLTSDSA